MRISIDVRHLESGPRTGVGVVTEELLPALFAAGDGHSFSVFSNGWREPPALLERLVEQEHVSVHRTRMPNRVFDVLAVAGALGKPRKLFHQADVHLSPHMLPLPDIRTPRVLILHDLSFIRYPEFFSLRSRAWHARVRPEAQAKAATRLIVPSSATAQDVVQLFGIAEKKISIVPWGTPSAAEDKNADAPQNRGDEQTVLFLGTVEHRKNVLGVLRAFVMLQKRLPKARLILAGGLGWGSDEVIRMVHAQPAEIRERISMPGYVSEEEKAKLLSEADVFVYPSFYEGSGLPVLEAMHAGVPCVVSRYTALPEVTQDAAVLVDPYDSEEIVEAVIALLLSRDLRETYATWAQRRASELTWEKTAAAVMDVLAAAAEESVKQTGQ